jgi:hypothetical protein
VSRPVNTSPANVKLYAFDAQLNQLFSADAGTWPNTGGNANIVPVANGRVYVASNKQLTIFDPPSTIPAAQTAAAATAQPLPPSGHEIYGIIQAINGEMLTLRTRGGAAVTVDTTEAQDSYQSVVLLNGEAVRVLGDFDASNVLHATAITHAKESPALWAPDR